MSISNTRRHLPSTRALVVFDAVARHHGLSKAAEALSLTHGAVSQQLRLLEDQLGVKLVQRTSRGSRLTEAGLRYHAQISGDLLRLENHTLEAMAQRPDGTSLLVGAVPVLAERWLIPRLPDFTRREPTCSLHLKVFPTQAYMPEPAFDVAVQYDDAVWPGALVQPLMKEQCVAVCAPHASGRREMKRGDFRAATLLQLTSRLGAWEDWFTQAGIDRTPTSTAAGHRFDLFSMVVEAVRANLGIGLLPRYFVARELEAGDLVLAHPHVGHGDRGYSVFLAPHRAHDPLAATFTGWLVEVAAGVA